MEMPARTFSSPLYRYGFNGKEKDDEAKGSGEQYDYKNRIYDPRVGRFLSKDPLSSNFPWYTPYQFAGNKPIWAMDLDGLEEWYYYNNAFGWTKSTIFGGPWTEAEANKLGYFSYAQAHESLRLSAATQARIDGKQRVQEAINAVNTIQKWNNPFGIASELNPLRGVVDIYQSVQDKKYVTAMAFAVGSFVDLGPLLRTYGREYTALAKNLATKYSIEETWKLHPVFRGMLIEARVSKDYIAKGFKWMAEEASKYFRYYDFYNAEKKLAVSLKTVNAEKNFDFNDILRNIDELATLRNKGSHVYNGVEYEIKQVQLDILMPKGYDRNKLIKVQEAAKNQGVKINIQEH